TLRFVVGTCSRTCLQPGVFTAIMAKLVGLWRRRAWRFWLPLYGPATLGASLARSFDCRSRRSTTCAPGVGAALADSALPIPGARSATASQNDLVSWWQTSGTAHTLLRVDREMEERCALCRQKRSSALRLQPPYSPSGKGVYRFCCTGKLDPRLYWAPCRMDPFVQNRRTNHL